MAVPQRDDSAALAPRKWIVPGSIVGGLICLGSLAWSLSHVPPLVLAETRALPPSVLIVASVVLVSLLGALGGLAYTIRRCLRQVVSLQQALQYESTARQQAEAQYQAQQEACLQREKLATMGTLLASVAHELHNPLGVLTLHANLLREEAPPGALAERATHIAQAAERSVQIVKNLLTLARQGPPERMTVDLNTIVETSVDLLAHPYQVDNIDVVLELAPDLPRLWADPHQLQQVLVNLLMNAHQALQEVVSPRRLTITTQTEAAQRQVQCTVTDTGPGISPDIQAHLFEPFFTTKPPGLGTGLGLTLCRDILASYGGSLHVDSRPGHGATFQVCLPVPEVSHPLVVPCTAPSPAAVPTCAILVVDDEPGITGALAYLLQREGHHVDTVANGLQALKKLQGRMYDVILSDFRMPELDGMGLYQALTVQHPQLLPRLIFLTGDTLNAATMQQLEQLGSLCLHKPFTAAAVRQVIQQALKACTA